MFRYFRVFHVFYGFGHLVIPTNCEVRVWMD
jgi:hypothetical protein